MLQQAPQLKFFALFFLMLLALPMASASLTISGVDGMIYGQDLKIDMRVSCYNQSESFCSASATCNISVSYPNATALITGKSMTNEGTAFSYILSQSQTGITGTYIRNIMCRDGESYGKRTDTFQITPNGRQPASANIIIFFSILFLVLIAGLLSLLIYDITRFATLDFDVRDVVFNLSAYFVLFGTYMLEKEYLANANVERFLSMIVTAGIYPFVFLAIIMFTVCFMFNLMGIRKENRKLK